MTVRPDIQKNPDQIITIAKRYVETQAQIISRLEAKEYVTDEKEIAILLDTVIRKTLMILLDAGYDVPESNMAIYLAFLQIPSMQRAVSKVLGY